MIAMAPQAATSLIDVTLGQVVIEVRGLRIGSVILATAAGAAPAAASSRSPAAAAAVFGAAFGAAVAGAPAVRLSAAADHAKRQAHFSG